MLDSDLTRASTLLRQATRVVVFTGAGVSAESGMPTFRSAANALWREVDVRNFAYPDGYRRNQPDAWRWYATRAAKAREVAPNAGHYAIAEMERRTSEVQIPRRFADAHLLGMTEERADAHLLGMTGERGDARRLGMTGERAGAPQDDKPFLLVTQNIDSLHQRAGSENVVELHGNLREVRCFECSARSPWPELASLPDPVCERCGGMLRPDVVMFEEMLPWGAMERATIAAEECDLLISVGTSNLVWPAAELPRYALRAGADVVIVNPDMSGQPSESGVIQLVGASGEILPELVRRAWSA